MLRVIGWAFVICLMFTSPSYAGYVINVSQVGNNVVATGSGRLNTAILNFVSNSSPVQAVTDPASAQLEVGSPVSRISSFGPVTGPASFGFGTTQRDSTDSGDFAGIIGANGEIEVSHSYVSGTTISGSATWDNTTISGLGMTPGTYKWTWASEAAVDFFIVNISAAAVPEPSSLILAGMALGIFCFQAGLRRRCPQ